MIQIYGFLAQKKTVLILIETMKNYQNLKKENMIFISKEKSKRCTRIMPLR
ncbi:TPA: hypothetical protein HA235_04970 [Candidatus Woesearchaeota archaeon]|nr:hypothetical protein [Candidatus Woesearchaeota archaeon]HIH32033.1 hypothetical protein [Candidatus Woesearchaeota archaeon]HIH54976.1 hypothetical protein [Candidatus Woesearchaeota archaeon]HIJ01632.1 hypothetical protein [Candidatus Woesearchaeota archaeon]HIJ13374.1 hypothetical protein [Candidatus Woesearchaeota archaeon]